ncbi:MAG TPA: MBL fold metallo-hydrolase [Aquabacterium sp.]|nr:MBL fold metallo-hydrolase [Aquabacterium sp.]HQC95929.1 MBL fold metallo-hydrolase [Aquabacterium sp.]
MPLPFVQALPHGIHVIDTGFHRPLFDAAYLIVENGRAAIVDSGTNFAVPRILAALDDLGLARDAVDFVIPTHVHLDHAGGCGLLMQELPRATLLVHPRGARHMIDPQALYQGALAVYGQATMDREYGALVPVPAERVRSVADDEVIALAGRPLRFIDTPGHARHHHGIWDARSAGWFTGDTFGLSYRETDSVAGAWVMPTSSPVQFEPGPLRKSIERLLATGPQRMYLTHYGMVEDVPRLAAGLLAQVDAMVAMAQALPASPDRHAQLKAGLQAIARIQLQQHGLADVEGALHSLALDIELNAQGLGVWLDRAER